MANPVNKEEKDTKKVEWADQCLSCRYYDLPDKTCTCQKATRFNKFTLHTDRSCWHWRYAF